MTGLGRYTTRFEPGRPGGGANPGLLECRAVIGPGRVSRVSRVILNLKGELQSPARRRYFLIRFRNDPGSPAYPVYPSKYVGFGGAGGFWNPARLWNPVRLGTLRQGRGTKRARHSETAPRPCLKRMGQGL